MSKNNKDKIHRPITKAGSSLENKTSSWGNMKPVIDPQICVGCERCVKLCPEACMFMKTSKGKRIADLDYDYCKACGVCAAECPVKAIQMIKSI